jgi:hypothetical protein
MTGLRIFFGLLLVVMLVATGAAAGDRSVFDAGAVLMQDAWFRATLADAYVGFLVAYAWIAYLERRWSARLVWLALVLALGNIAVTAYVLRRLLRLPASATVEDLLVREAVPR